VVTQFGRLVLTVDLGLFLRHHIKIQEAEPQREKMAADL
jgi:hypothetical protein